MQICTQRFHTGVVFRHYPDVFLMPGDIFDWYAVVNRRIISAHVAYVAGTFAALLQPTAST